jgi:hypothetical protein
MRKIIALVAFIMLFGVAVLSAHPASNVTASFDSAKSLLTITWKHQVKNNADHFIFNVMVKKNKKLFITQKLGYQDSLTGGSLVFKVNDAKPDDVFEATVICNKGGMTKASLTIK